MRKTLADLNAALERKTGTFPFVREGETPDYITRREFAVGGAGRAGRGSHTHVVLFETITAEPNGHRPGTMKVGDVFTAHPLCHGNYGQHGARPIAGYDTDRVTCSKCAKKIEVQA